MQLETLTSTFTTVLHQMSTETESLPAPTGTGTDSVIPGTPILYSKVVATRSSSSEVVITVVVVETLLMSTVETLTLNTLHSAPTETLILNTSHSGPTAALTLSILYTGPTKHLLLPFSLEVSSTSGRGAIDTELAVGLIVGILCIAAGLLWYWNNRRRKITCGEVIERPGIEPYTKVEEAGWDAPRPAPAVADAHNMLWDVINIGFVDSGSPVGDAASAEQTHAPILSYSAPKVPSKASLCPSPPSLPPKLGWGRADMRSGRQLDSGLRFAPTTPTAQVAQPSVSDLPPAYTDY